MTHYRKTQQPAWFVAMLVCILTVVAVIFVYTELYISLGVVLAIVVLLALLFSRLTVEVDEEEIRLRFGVGWLRRAISREDVAQAEKVRNAWWYGFGIRLTPHGWMWNISGLDAVELTYKDGKKFRIGTGDPDGLLEALRQWDIAVVRSDQD